MNIRLLFLLILPLALASCVSQQKYNRAVDAQARMNLLRQQYLADNHELEALLDSLQKDTVFIAETLSTPADTNMATARLNSEAQDEMISKNVEMGQTRGAELNETATVDNNPVMTAQMHEIEQKENIVNQLSTQLNTSLAEFSSQELNMRVEQEGVYITLHENFLFNGPDLNITTKGQQALSKLAVALNKQAHAQIRIEGHIDTPTANENNDEDSWEISTKRAIAVGKALNTQHGIDGKRMIISGRGDFFPLAENQYPMARSLNRRVEIILIPQLPAGSGLDALNKK